MSLINTLLICYVLFSWLLHSYIHETAHTCVANTFGFATTKKIFPSFINNRLTYASFTMTRTSPIVPYEQQRIFFAPVVPELVWFILFGSSTFIVKNSAVCAFLALEAVMAGVDLSIWLMSLIRYRTGTDGQMWWSAIDSEDTLRARIIGTGILLVLLSGMFFLFMLNILPLYK